MKVFDVHIHVQPWEMLRPDVLAIMDDESHSGAREIIRDPDRLVAFFDQQGIEKACLINYVAPEVMGFTRGVNDWIAEYVRSHRDRLLPVGSVNPRDDGSVRDEIRRVLDLGVRLVKIHPPHQLFAPNAYRFDLPDLAQLYEECQASGIPVMIHTGTSVFPGARNVYADPMPVDDVAVDFPNLTIILAHAGRPLYGDTAFFLVRRHRNVFIDLSGIPPKAIPRFVPRLEEIRDRVLWGTDWPSPGVISPAANVEAFRSLGYSEATQSRVLRQNAEAIFR